MIKSKEIIHQKQTKSKEKVHFTPNRPNQRCCFSDVLAFLPHLFCVFLQGIILFFVKKDVHFPNASLKKIILTENKKYIAVIFDIRGDNKKYGDENIFLRGTVWKKGAAYGKIYNGCPQK